MVLHSLLRRLYDRFRGGPVDAHSPTTAGTSPTNGAVAADVSQQRRTSFDLYFALLFITVLHGSSALKILLILYINFSLTALPKHVIPATTWIFNIAILFANELAHGYSYVRILDSIVPLSAPAVKFGNNLDAYGGLIPRWEILFNFTVLRLISFNLDYYWSLGHDQAGARIEVCVALLMLFSISHSYCPLPWISSSQNSFDQKPRFCVCFISARRLSNTPKEKQVDPTNFSERERISTPAASKTYASFPTYLAYALYSPLYLAGPVITFNDYISQSRYPSPLLTLRRTALYSIRLLLALVSMELLLHTIYAVAISKSSPEWSTYSPFQLAMLAYFNLHIVWQKLLVFWRFFRLWAMIDHVDPPENVVRCMSDNYSTLAFWRGWHRSYNRWIVRYIYIPLGGSGGKGASRTRGVLNMLAIFTFVAVWHDINLRLLAWGWLITLFVLPEVLATVAFPAKKWQGRPEVYRMICGVGAVFNILLMMAANLVGFAVGLDGLTGLLTGILRSQSGWAFLLATCAALYVGVQVMFEVREGELRKGIRLKC